MTEDIPDRDVPPEDAPRRLRAAQQLLSAPQFRESAGLAPPPLIAISLLAGAQAALATLIALPLVLLSPWPHLIGFAALGALPALFGRFAPPARRGWVVLQCGLAQTCAVLAMSIAAWAGLPLSLQIVLLAMLAGLAFFFSVATRIGPPGALIFIFAASASMGRVGSISEVGERASATGAIALLALAICVATERLRHSAGGGAQLPAEPPKPLGEVRIAAVRVAIGAAIAAFGAYAIGAEHPGWAAMGAMAVMQGAHLHIHMNRALQRTAGTVVGAFLIWLMLGFAPSSALVIAVLVALTVATEVIIGFNYALGQVLITPMALLMTHLAAPHAEGATLAIERVLDTTLGATVGVALALLMSSLGDRRHLYRHHARRSKPGMPDDLG